MAIALVGQTTNSHQAGSQMSVDHPDPIVLPGVLLIVYAISNADTAVEVTAPAGWTQLLSLFPFEGNKRNGKLFAKISDGGQDTGGIDGAIGPFSPVSKVFGSWWSGASRVQKDGEHLGSAEVLTSGTHSRTRTVTTTPGGLALMVGGFDVANSTIAAEGSSTFLQGVTAEPGAALVYRLGGGSLANQMGNNAGASRWFQCSAVALGVGLTGKARVSALLA